MSWTYSKFVKFRPNLNVCYLACTEAIILRLSVVIQARFQLCAYKFCLKSSDCKGLKTLSLCMHANCILLGLFNHVRSENPHNVQFPAIRACNSLHRG